MVRCNAKLLTAILENPDDTGARLALAHWLEQQRGKAPKGLAHWIRCQLLPPGEAQVCQSLTIYWTLGLGSGILNFIRPPF
jgi:uncharacterized protein (TIGR02996 family)